MWVWRQVPLGGSSPRPLAPPPASPRRPLPEHRQKRQAGGAWGEEGGEGGSEGLWLEGRVLQSPWGGYLQSVVGARPTSGGSRFFGPQWKIVSRGACFLLIKGGVFRNLDHYNGKIFAAPLTAQRIDLHEAHSICSRVLLLDHLLGDHVFLDLSVGLFIPKGAYFNLMPTSLHPLAEPCFPNITHSSETCRDLAMFLEDGCDFLCILPCSYLSSTGDPYPYPLSLFSLCSFSVTSLHLSRSLFSLSRTSISKSNSSSLAPILPCLFSPNRGIPLTFLDLLISILRDVCMYIWVCIYLYIYIYAVVLLSGPSLAFWGVIIWAKFAFYKTLFVKNTIKIGVSALFVFEKKLRAQIWGVIIWAKLVIFKMQSTWPR